MLQADIDSGRTGDKIPALDPGLAPLGTDDEAAGMAPSPPRVASARSFESVARWFGGRPRPVAAHTDEGDGWPVGYIACIVAIGVVLLVGIALVR
jgi:hypothetical protein